MKDFNFRIPQNIEFGLGSLKKLPAILKENKFIKNLVEKSK